MEIRNLFREVGSPADLRYKEEERKRPREIAEKTAREEYTLDWSQSKVFLVFKSYRINITYFQATGTPLRPCDHCYGSRLRN